MDAIQQETRIINVRLVLAKFLVFFLPAYSFNRTRTLILRMAGIQIGSKSLFADAPHFSGEHGLINKLFIGNYCWFGPGCSFDLADRIIIGDHVTIGPENMLITGTHMIGSSDHRAGKLAPKPVHIMNGAWLGARVIVLPGVTIGAGVVVGAGSLVNRDLPADTLCAGVPARVIREINLDPEQGR